MLASLRKSLAGKLSAQVVAARSLATSAPQLGNHSHNDPHFVTHHKEKHLKGESHTTIPNMEGWSEALASDSEANIKAERHRGELSIEDLQKHSVEVVQKVHHKESTGTKTGEDKTQQPSIKDNLEHTKSKQV